MKKLSYNQLSNITGGALLTSGAVIGLGLLATGGALGVWAGINK
ncbi:hypothetical protein AMBR_FBHANALA_01741 [Dolosigranulum pigrum]|uniref:Bacteriocin n=1 Tax=Dolosigranulum savutiense TaxID=3110288 RepID=A0AB74TQE1_9LACT|nr:bacteriocin [Dolosigranulum pigrum]QTJ57022.1 bacteriocin [Dolosigranulum pigrum]VTU63121.1 hypothetical protein AMBR_FBHANALA_01741 [Dolosigranulum pigrum]